MPEFFYKKPDFIPDEEGNRVIINKCCVGPIEAVIYGITKDNRYYCDWTYPEFYPGDDELERDYRIITKNDMIRALDFEINICRKKGNIEMADEYINAKSIIENYKY